MGLSSYVRLHRGLLAVRCQAELKLALTAEGATDELIVDILEQADSNGAFLPPPLPRDGARRPNCNQGPQAAGAEGRRPGRRARVVRAPAEGAGVGNKHHRLGHGGGRGEAPNHELAHVPAF